MISNSMIYITSALALTEIGLGSLVHGLRIPLGGHLLSLNQAFLLSLLAIDVRNRRSTAQFEASLASSLLKTLAPAGKKLTPMLAIATQGLLHNLGTLIFGTGFLGVMQANILLGLWAIVQPWLVYYLLYGRDLFNMALYFMDKLRPLVEVTFQHIWIAIWALVILKSLLAVAVTWAAFKLDRSWIEKYLSRLSQVAPRPEAKASSVPRGVLRDLTSPLFLASFILMCSFYILTDTQAAQMLWHCLRPLAIAIVVFTLLRIIPLRLVADNLERMGLKRVSRLLTATIEHIKQKRD